MDLSMLQEVCERYNDSDSSFYLDPTIPVKKVRNAVTSLNISSAEKIIALIDLTVFGSAKDAIVITDRGLHWKQIDENPINLTWNKFGQYSPSEDNSGIAKSIKFDNEITLSLSGAGIFSLKDNHDFLQLMNDHP